MIGAILPSIGSLIILLIISILYFKKSKDINKSNIIYKMMIIILIVMLILEMISLKTIYYKEFIPFLNELICRLDYLLAILWMYLLLSYLYNLGKENNFNNIYEYITKNKIYRIIGIVFLITVFIYSFLPFEYNITKDFGYLTGPAINLNYIVGIFTLISMAVMFFINLKKIGKKNAIYAFVSYCILLVVLIMQVLLPDILLVTTGFSLILFTIYFTIENPDLYVIKELELAKMKLENSSKAKTDFLSNMSHEIRTPMNAIINFSENLVNSKDYTNEEINKTIMHIYSAGSNLLEIINNILDISKIETDSQTVEEKEYSLGSIILELTSIIEARIVDNRVKFITEVDENIPKILKGDKTKLFQILLNILSNSVKYTEVGKIVFKVECENQLNNCRLLFTISDTGFGIKEEDYDKLFSKFSRLDSATQNEIEGTGLGLVITKKLVNLLGGTIKFESVYGAGTTFYIELNQKIVKKEKIGNILETEIKSNDLNYIDCSKYKVLIVDDNKLNIKVAKRVLEPYKFQIESVNTGKECINKIKEEHVYDMIFLDHMMPQMDGIETLHIIKNLKDYSMPIVVALTANAITGMKEMYLNEGFDEYLSKPINTSELNKIIIKYFDKK